MKQKRGDREMKRFEELVQSFEDRIVQLWNSSTKPMRVPETDFPSFMRGKIAEKDKNTSKKSFQRHWTNEKIKEYFTEEEFKKFLNENIQEKPKGRKRKQLGDQTQTDQSHTSTTSAPSLPAPSVPTIQHQPNANNVLINPKADEHVIDIDVPSVGLDVNIDPLDDTPYWNIQGIINFLIASVSNKGKVDFSQSNWNLLRRIAASYKFVDKSFVTPIRVILNQDTDDCPRCSNHSWRVYSSKFDQNGTINVRRRCHIMDCRCTGLTIWCKDCNEPTYVVHYQYYENLEQIQIKQIQMNQCLNSRCKKYDEFLNRLV
eukprot:TRINITY_DN14165_c0_g1_i1.p1 TRINITY_DN14165_c0_g1~~TRINITY_DN14165_c0_g1_i1.p1  ORF type:complete len:316 (+),score=51.07 TRINITY_DN14165_c0_g1_i1:68-1015(+)